MVAEEDQQGSFLAGVLRTACAGMSLAPRLLGCAALPAATANPMIDCKYFNTLLLLAWYKEKQVIGAWTKDKVVCKACERV